MNTEGEVLLASVFDHFIANDANLFNAIRLAPTEEEHCKIYYSFVSPKKNAVIVDLGCGIGEVGAQFQRFDPSLKVINVVNDKSLINYMKTIGRFCIDASMDNTPIPDQFADNVMFNESIGYIPLDSAFKEAARLLKPNGVLTIKDFSNVSPSNKNIYLENWSYTINQPEAFIHSATKHGFSIKTISHPPMYTKHWYDIMEKSDVAKQSAMKHDPSKLPLCMSLYYFIKGNLNGRSRDAA